MLWGSKYSLILRLPPSPDLDGAVCKCNPQCSVLPACPRVSTFRGPCTSFPNPAHAGSLALESADPVGFLSQTFAGYILASEDFFDKLTVEQEFMSGIDTDKVGRAIPRQS